MTTNTEAYVLIKGRNFLPDPELYWDKILWLVEQLGGWRSVSRVMGIGHSTLERRVRLRLYKREWDLAADEIIHRLGDPNARKIWSDSLWT